MQNEDLFNLLIDLCAILLSLVGVLMTIATVLSSFLLSKRDLLRLHAEEKKRGKEDYMLDRLIRVETRFIERTQKHLHACFILLGLSSSLLSAIYLCKYSLDLKDERVVLWVLVSVSLLVVLVAVLYLVWQFRSLWKDVKLEKKLDK